MMFQVMVGRLTSSLICAQWFDSQQCVTVILDLKVSLAQLCKSCLKYGGVS